jgi:hypothetical protein
MTTSSVAAEYDEDEVFDALTPVVGMEFDAQKSSMDLLGVGAGFEGEAVGFTYVCEIDVGS